jgi:hypothetical protein
VQSNKSLGLFVATPVHSNVSMHYMSACLNLQNYFVKNNIPIQFCLKQDSVITQNRNKCVTDFLKTDSTFTHFLFVDSDIYFDFNSILKMINANKDVISMPYPIKKINYKKMWSKIQKGEIKNEKQLEAAGYTYPVKIKDNKSFLDENGIMEVSHSPTGTLLIKKEVFYKIINACPDLKITEEVEEPYYNFFDFYHDKKNKKYYGEDFNFCKLWSSLGGKCYAYVMDEVAHIGDHAYFGRMYDDLIIY